MQKGIKFRIYPNKGQKAFIHQTLGCCRFIYNRGLAMRKEGYEKRGKNRLWPDFCHADGTEKAGRVCFSERSRFHRITAVIAGVFDRGIC